MRKLTLTELSLCCSIVYHYNDAEWYVQFLQGSRLDGALILLGVAVYLPSLCILGLHAAV